MNADQRATIQLIVGSALAFTIVGLVGYLVIQSTDLGERGQLIGTLSGGFGAAIAFFLRNMNPNRQTGSTVTVPQDPPSPPITVTTGDQQPDAPVVRAPDVVPEDSQRG